MKTFFTILRRLLIIVCLCVMCYSGWNLWQIYQSYQEGKELYAQLSDMAVTVTEEESFPEPTQEQDPTSEETDTAEKTEIGISVDFAALKEINPDIAAWIYGPDTDISYPVVHGNDNTYYLNHLLDGSTNKNGTIFVDAQNEKGFVDQNTILYGHHMKNGTMFATLEKYREQDYYVQHPVFYLLTPEQNYQLEIFSACVVQADDEVYQKQFNSEEEYAQWLQRQVERSDVTSAVTVSDTDQIITLSTCAYDFENARYVVLARLISLG